MSSFSFRKLGSLMMVATASSTLAATLPFQAAQAQGYEYSAQLVQQYNSGCSSRLQQKGYSTAQAQSLCACSLKQMQMQHNQASAIAILAGAQFNPNKDPKLGLPSTLSKYFTPCFG